MSVEAPTSKATGFGSWETWAIACLLFGGGLGAGYPLGQKVVRVDAERQVSEIQAAYQVANQAKDDLIKQCLYKADEAISTAAGAAEQAKEAADQAKSAAEAVQK